MFNSPHITSKPPTRRIPAWLLSAAVHLVLIVLLAVIVRGPSVVATQPADKEVGIVLAAATPSDTQYFDSKSVESVSPTEATPNEVDAAQSLPEAAANISDIELPKLDSADAGLNLGVGVVAAPDFSAGKGGVVLPGEDLSDIIAAERAVMAARKTSSGPATSLAPFGGGRATGNSFVFLLDRSRSMGDEGLGALAAAETELKAQLSLLGPEHKFQIIGYNHKPVYVGSKTLLAANKSNVAKAPEFFSSLAAIGKTEHEMALLAAIRLKPDVIFLLTDGGVPGMTPGQINRVVKRAAKATTIHSFEFGLNKPSEGNRFLKVLAEATGGSYAFLDLSAKKPTIVSE